MKFLAISAAAALAAVSVNAQAQDAAAAVPAAAAADVTTGATVYGSDGAVIGTVESVMDSGVVVNTGVNSIPLPANAFGTSDQGPTLNITKTELDAKFEQQMAAQKARLDAALVAGAEVMTADAQPLGTIKMIDGENIVLERASGPLTLPKQYFAVDANGAPMVRANLAQIEAAASAGG
ncbi:hypothetical protein [Altericroceibacterium xinjiangense]|uniref:hypothetical protein n=1 Tax=Altericroceibacterium xinjiangense TaxID=762261 RepID=UPI000F7F9D02|nr:hypothetical protein [Altericroceibacterium xinjiangense]